MLNWIRRFASDHVSAPKLKSDEAALHGINVLYVYCCTVDGDAFKRLQHSLAEQIRLNKNTMSASYLFLDRMPDKLPPILSQFFGSRIETVDPYIADPHGERQFCMPRFRNASIRKARDLSANYMFCCDADTAIYHVSPPSEGSIYAFPYLYWQRDPEETVEDSIRIIEAEGVSAFAPGNSWFVIHKDVFSNIDFNERMLAYGYEDWEFQQRASAIAPKQDRCDTRIIHLFHTIESRNISEYHLSRNKDIWQATCLAQDLGQLSHWSNTEVVEAVHPEWRNHIVLDRKLGLAFNGPGGVSGGFEERDEAYVIAWQGRPAETFHKRGSFIELRHIGT